MKVLINPGPPSSKGISGIGQHTYYLWQSLNRIVSCEISDYKYIHHLPPIVKRLAHNFVTNIDMYNRKFDIVHFLTHYVPFVNNKQKKIVTIHDLIPFRCAQTIPSFWRAYNRSSTQIACQRATAIITLSTFTKNEILDLFPIISPEKIYVCGGGLREIFYSYKPVENDITKLGVKPFSYFLFVGDLTLRKNLKFLIETFNQAKLNKLLSTETKLILTGKRAFGFSTIKSLINNKDIIELGFIEDHILVGLYKYAKAFVFPSIYEGYGTPLLEAMSQNCPIIISNIEASNELNNQYNRLMYSFELQSKDELLALLEKLDKDFETIRNTLNYGNLLAHTYDEIARRHVIVYSKLLGEK